MFVQSKASAAESPAAGQFLRCFNSLSIIVLVFQADVHTLCLYCTSEPCAAWTEQDADADAGR